MPQCSFHSSRLFAPFLIHKTEYQNNLYTDLPPSKILMKNLTNHLSVHVHLILHRHGHSVVSGNHPNFSYVSDLQSVDGCPFLGSSRSSHPSPIFEPSKDGNLIHSFISINTFQQLLHFCSNFPKSETKPDLLWLLHDDKGKHNYTKLLWVSSLS